MSGRWPSFRPFGRSKPDGGTRVKTFRFVDSILSGCPEGGRVSVHLGVPSPMPVPGLKPFALLIHPFRICRGLPSFRPFRRPKFKTDDGKDPGTTSMDLGSRPGPASYLVLRNSPILSLIGPANSGSFFPRTARSRAEWVWMTIPGQK